MTVLLLGWMNNSNQSSLASQPQLESLVSTEIAQQEWLSHEYLMT